MVQLVCCIEFYLPLFIQTNNFENLNVILLPLFSQDNNHPLLGLELPFESPCNIFKIALKALFKNVN